MDLWDLLQVEQTSSGQCKTSHSSCCFLASIYTAVYHYRHGRSKLCNSVDSIAFPTEVSHRAIPFFFFFSLLCLSVCFWI